MNGYGSANGQQLLSKSARQWLTAYGHVSALTTLYVMKSTVLGCEIPEDKNMLCTLDHVSFDCVAMSCRKVADKKGCEEKRL